MDYKGVQRVRRSRDILKSRLTVVLFTSPSGWEPWAIAPLDECPLANTTTVG